MNTEAVVYLKVNDDILTCTGDPYIDWFDSIEWNGQKFNIGLDFEISDVDWFTYQHIEKPLYLKSVEKQISDCETQMGYDLYERVEVLEFA